jgi:hypothetical protein
MLKEQMVRTSGLLVVAAVDVDPEDLLPQLVVPVQLGEDHMLELVMELLQMVLQQQQQVFSIPEVAEVVEEKIIIKVIVLAQMVLRDLLLSHTAERNNINIPRTLKF